MKRFLLASLMGMLIGQLAFGADIKGQIGADDIKRGEGTFTRRTSTGGTITLDKLNAGNLPVNYGTANDSYASTGTVPFSVNDALSTWVDVRAYRAVGDNTADDTEEIQAAIDAVEAVGYGIIYFPPGTYKITTGLTVNSNGVVLRGAGKGISKIHAVYTGTTPAIKFIGIASARLDYAGIEGLTVYTTTGTAPDYGIHIDYSAYFKAYDVEVSYFRKRAFDLRTVWQADFDHIFLFQNGRDSASTDGTLSLTSSSVVAGQCTQSTFSNIQLGSNFGTNIYSVNASGNSSINFFNLALEDDPSENATSDNNAIINISNNTDLHIVNFTFTANTKPLAASKTIFQMTGPNWSRGVYLVNGTFGANGNDTATLTSMIDWDTAQGELELTNVMFSDYYEKIPVNKFINVTTGGLSKIRMNGVGFFTSKTLTQYFSDTTMLQGTFWRELGGTVTYYSLGNWSAAPGSKTEACISGMYAKDASYLYWCYGDNTWRRTGYDNTW